MDKRQNLAYIQYCCTMCPNPTFFILSCTYEDARIQPLHIYNALYKQFRMCVREDMEIFRFIRLFPMLTTNKHGRLK